MKIRSYLRRDIAVTREHGSWVFLFSPLFIGLFAGDSWGGVTPYLFLACLAGFMIRQPMTIAVKALSGRRSRKDIPPALFWMFIYAGLGGLGVWGLLKNDFPYLLLLVVPGIFVFAWYLGLVYRRVERGQMGVEIVASGVLALAAPAGYWIGVGHPHPLGWWLWLLNWFQSAASIVYIFLRLKQRKLGEIPSVAERIWMGWRALSYSGFNLGVTVFLSMLGWLPSGIFIPYLLQFLETLWGVFQPAVGYKPTKIGLRQLIVSILFTLLFIFSWKWT
ncbi:MAG: YwiC-like family protein [Anaerolineales bacterium]